ncbi:MAG TPA: LysM peptidoglycan-binding domain-containing protein, partial [Gammaproteobacteria bacterium]|nr:LysM peptidoglycan-binding domain-containing protein [Gammaproteobacteria bacterium]
MNSFRHKFSILGDNVDNMPFFVNQHNMNQIPLYKFALILGCTILLFACANQPLQTHSAKLPPPSTTLTESAIQKQPADTNQLADGPDQLTEPPLFTQMILQLDPIMWTNESEEQPAINLGNPQIVGRFPGQRKLPVDLFEEAAETYSLGTKGSVVFFSESKERDLWQRVRAGFTLPHQINRRIQNHINWYARHQSYVIRVVNRAKKYLYQIVEETEKMGVPLEIALLPVVESAFQPFAYSHGRAAGLWQFIPSTGKMYGLKQNWWYDGRRDVMTSTVAALKYLKHLHDSLNNDWLLALAAYNSGSGTVRKAIRKNKRKNKPTDFWSLDLPRETRSYVPKLIAIAEIVSDPDKYHIQLPAIQNMPYMIEVEIQSQIDLALAAKLADIKLETLYILNPAFNRWATDPDGPHKLMLPVDKANIFKTNLANLPKDKRLTWKRHKVKRGESLLLIADKYNTTATLIKDLNQIRSSLIREGQSLIIPVSSRDGKTYRLSANQRQLAIQNTHKKGKEKTTYIVKSGDSFWSISRKFKVGYRRLAKWNGLAPNDMLRPGKKLVVWLKNAAPFRAVFSPHSRKMTTQKIRYRVRNGDSFARVSQKFKVKLADLKRWNHRLSKQKYLQPGQRLT